MPNPAEKVIEHDGFNRETELTNDMIQKLIVKSYGDAARSLIKDWKGNPVMILGAQLAPDNKTLDNVEPVLAGTLFRKTARKYVSTKFWNFPDKTHLVLQPIDLTLFRFDDSMDSGYVDSSEVSFSFQYEDGSEVPEATLADQGFAGFSLKVFLIPVSGMSAKMKLVLFPAKKSVLKDDHAYSNDARFPGLTVTSVEVQIGVNYSVVSDKALGTTIVPCLMSQKQYDSSCEVPSTEHVIACVSSLMRTAVVPETVKSHKELWQRWGEIAKDGPTKLQTMAREFVWPAYTVTIDPGWSIKFIVT